MALDTPVTLGTYLRYAVPEKMPIAPFKNLQAWFARIETLPAWQQTAPKH